MDYGSRRISQETIDKFWRVHNLISEMPGQFNVNSTAQRLGLASSTVSRFITQKPWSQAFTRDDYGMLKPTGFLPHPREEKKESPKQPIDNPGQSRDNNLFTQFNRSVQEHVRKASEPDAHVVEEYLLSGEQEADLVNRMLAATEEKLQTLEAIRQQANFGNDDWWIDFYDPTS